jgi:hypothetical protein
MKQLVNEFVKQYLKLRMKRIEQYMRRPDPFQERWLLSLLETAAKTSVGIKYHFSEIKDGNEYANRVPVQDYNQIKASIEKMMLGYKDVLWPGEVNWYSKSSGTTEDKSKFIPVPYSNLYKCHLSGPWDSLALLYYNRPDVEIFRRKNLILPGSFSSYSAYPKTRTGDISAILTYHMPTIGKIFYTPDIDLALQPFFETKLKTIANQIKDEDIGMIAGVPTWIIVLFNMMLAHNKKQNMLEIWPNLQVYMHGGVGFNPYRETFNRFIPTANFIYQEIYNASEGYFAAQCDFDRNDMLLFSDNGIYYEFAELKDIETPFPVTVPLSDIEVGKNYAMIISTNGGLWRYLLGDTIIFTRKNPHCFYISGRTKQYINVFGEELMVGDAEKALTATCRQFNVVVNEYTVAPVFFSDKQENGGHQWVIEFERSPVDIAAFEKSLDKEIQRVNSDYEAKRQNDLALQQLTLTPIPKGTFLAWMRSRGKFGNQNKIPRLSNTRDTIEQILAFSKNHRQCENSTFP